MIDSPVLPVVLPSRVHLGWIGTGVMGLPICEHLLRAGYSLSVYSRTKAKAGPLLAQGATWLATPAELTVVADVVLTMVGFPADVRDVYLGKDGILSRARSGQVFIDLTTSDPALAQEIAQQASGIQAVALDAPVSGGEVGAQQGGLSVMVGGDEAAVEAMKPLFTIFGKLLIHHGAAGSGQHAKLCNQITIAGTMIGVCEALLYAHRAGLNGNKLLDSIRQGAAGCWTLDYLAPKMLKRDFSPGFFVEHFIKDMGIALAEGNRMGLLLPGLSVVHKLYQAVQTYGHGRSGTHALLLALESLSPTHLSDARPVSLSTTPAQS